MYFTRLLSPKLTAKAADKWWLGNHFSFGAKGLFFKGRLLIVLGRAIPDISKAILDFGAVNPLKKINHQQYTSPALKNCVNDLNWANYNDVSRGHPKWWFNKGTSPKSPKHSGLGIILICPDLKVMFWFADGWFIPL